jgi:hypothetical protein
MCSCEIHVSCLGHWAGDWRAIGWLMAIAALLFCSNWSQTAYADVSISPSVASLFVGEEKIVEGTVVTAQREGDVVHLQLGNPPQVVAVSLVLGLLSKFPPDPERYYLGKTVRVGGVIQSFRGKTEITVHDPAHIEVVDVSHPPPAAAAPPVNTPPAANVAAADHANVPSPETSIDQRLDAMSERIRALEDRVQQLERPGSQ